MKILENVGILSAVRTPIGKGIRGALRTQDPMSSGQ